MGGEKVERSRNTPSEAKERLLYAADQLFYAHGIQTVGIDRVLDKANVAKASLYTHFGSKDELVREYLEGRMRGRQALITQAIAKHDKPRAKIVAIFDLLAEVIAAPGFRGCAFVRARAEGDESKIEDICDKSRAWTRTLLTDLARALGVSDPKGLASRLHLLYGAVLSDSDPNRAKDAKAMAELLLDSAPKRAKK